MGRGGRSCVVDGGRTGVALTRAARAAAMSWLRDALRRLPEPDMDAAAAVRARAADNLRPSGALARLDDVAVHMAAWQRTAAPRVTRPSALVFAGDHGVAEH